MYGNIHLERYICGSDLDYEANMNWSIIIKSELLNIITYYLLTYQTPMAGDLLLFRMKKQEI